MIPVFDGSLPEPITDELTRVTVATAAWLLR